MSDISNYVSIYEILLFLASLYSGVAHPRVCLQFEPPSSYINDLATPPTILPLLFARQSGIFTMQTTVHRCCTFNGSVAAEKFGLNVRQW
jgi:hypothetical protein